MHLSLLGPQGLRELGETCMALAAYAKERLGDAGLEPVFPEKATFREFAVRTALGPFLNQDKEPRPDWIAPNEPWPP